MANNSKGSSGSSSKSYPVGRNAETGRITTVEYAKSHPKTHVVERMPKPGRGDS